MSRAGARGAWTADRSACTPRITLRRSSDGLVGWLAEGRSGGPAALLAVGPGQRPLQPAMRASTPLPAKDDGSIALGFMVSLEGRQAGHFTWSSAPFPQCRWREEAAGQQESPPPPAPPPTLCVGLSWIRVFLTLSFLLSSTSMVTVDSTNPCSTDSFL